MLRDALTVYLKELRDTLRDRRTLLFMVVLPMILVPLLGGLVTRTMTDAVEEASTKSLRYAVVGAQVDPTLVETFGAAADLQRVAPPELGDPMADLRARRLDFVLSLSSGPDRQVVAELHHDDASTVSRVEPRVRAVVEQTAARRRDDRLAEAGLATAQARESAMNPIVLVPHGIASRREVLGERVGGMVPYLFVVFCFLGAMVPAIDLGAAEKERGTLETILIAPIGRASLVVGKFGVVMTTALVSTLLGTLSLGTWLALEASSAPGPLGGVLEAIGPGELALVVVLFVPVAALFSAGLLSLSIFAKSFKEAQSYLGALNAVAFVPAMVGMLPGVELDPRWAVVPIANVSLAIEELVKGTMDPTLLALVFASSAVMAASMLVVAVRVFSRESVLFRG